MAAYDEAACGHLFALEVAALEAHGLVLVLLRLLGKVTVPDGVVVIAYLDDGCVHIERQGVFDIVVLHIAVGVLVGNIASA